MLKNFFRQRARSLSENIFWGIYGEVFSRVVKFFQLILIAQFLGAEGMGLFNYSLAAAGIMAVFYDFGLLVVATKNNTKARTPENLVPYFLVKLVNVLFAFAIFLFLLWGDVLNTSDVYALALLVASILISDLGNLVLASYRAHQDFLQEARFRSLFILSQCLATILVFAVGGTLFDLSLILLLCSLSFMIPVLNRVFAQFRDGVSELALSIRRIVIECLPYAGIVMVGSIYTNADVLVLGAYLSLADVGVYVTAVKFILGLVIVPITFIQNAQIPQMMSQSESEVAPFRENSNAWRDGYGKTILCGYTICLFFAFFSDTIVALTFGSEFSRSAYILPALTLVGASYYLYTPIMTLFIVNGTPKITFYVQLVCCILNISLLFVLVPSIGVNGAVAASITSHILIFFFLLVVGIKYFRELFPGFFIIRLLAAFACFVVTVFLIEYIEFESISTHLFLQTISLVGLSYILRREFISFIQDLTRLVKRYRSA